MVQTVLLEDEAASDRLAGRLAVRLRAGDCVLFHGPIGAGKSHLARAMIRTRLGRMEDVPSPTFTLVQVYDDAETEIWHADLYRLSHPDDVLELGLIDAFQTAICLVEWPERLGSLAPVTALNITLSAKGEGRVASISGGRPGLLDGLR